MYTMEELIPLVAKLAEQYTGYESTSISYEKAGQLMEAVLYCIKEGEFSEKKNAIQSKRNAKEAYEFGYQQVLKKVYSLKELYHSVLLKFDSYGNRCLQDTIVKGIPEFFKWYDIKYAPQDTILTLDYPILIDIGASSGVDALYQYVKCVSLEQSFLEKFPKEYVEHVLEEYSEEGGELIENISSIVLQNTLFHMLLKKPLQEKNFSGEEYDKLEKEVSGYFKEDLERKMMLIVEEVMEGKKEEGHRILEYFRQEIENIAVRVQHKTEKSQFSQ